MFAKALTIILGLWLVVSAFVGLGPQGLLWSDLVSGILIAIFGFTAARESTGSGVVAGILGLWAIVCAFIPGLRTGGAMVWNNVIVGAIVFIAGLTIHGQSTRPHAVGGEAHAHN